MFIAKLLLWYSSGSLGYYEPLVLLVLISGAGGVVTKKEWGRKLILIASVIGFGYYLIDLTLISIGFDPFALLALIACLVGLFIYSQSLAKYFFTVGFDTPHWTILVVDDDRTFLKMIKANFSRLGLTVMTAEDGEKGLEIAMKKTPDLIILDVILPGIKGRTVCSKLKEDSRTRDIPIIFLTIKDSQDDINAEIEAGAVLHMTKPVDFKQVYLEIRKILD
jgi:CheY-like chemotaxis protein